MMKKRDRYQLIKRFTTDCGVHLIVKDKQHNMIHEEGHYSRHKEKSFSELLDIRPEYFLPLPDQEYVDDRIRLFSA